MNCVNLVGRLTRDPITGYTTSGMAVCKFTVAIDRKKRNEDKITDYINVTAFDKLAENCERFIGKGSLVGIQAYLASGHYENKHGETIYTLDVNANRVEFLDKKKEQKTEEQHEEEQHEEEQQELTPEGFTAIDEDIPF